MLTESTRGIWCRKDRKWYYYEPGVHSISNTIGHVKRTLAARDLITVSTSPFPRGEEPYLLMPYSEAKEKGYEVVVLYPNKHVEAMCKTQEQKAVSSPWD